MHVTDSTSNNRVHQLYSEIYSSVLSGLLGSSRHWHQDEYIDYAKDITDKIFHEERYSTLRSSLGLYPPSPNKMRVSTDT